MLEEEAERRMAGSLRVTHRWVCPNCRREEITRTGGRLVTPYHPCPKLRGLMAPMVPANVSAKVELVEREDYVGREQVQVDPERGRPVMAVVTTRDDGQDATVMMPSASAHSDI